MVEVSLPEESEAQKIGHNASKCFNANCPDSWRVHSLEGTDDAGFDYQIQVVSAGKYRDIFRVQLKGAQSPQLNVSGEYFSIALKARTLNYYDRVTEPVLLVLCDLSVDLARPVNCPLYYVWIQEEIQRHRSANPEAESQTTLTIRVPRANVLTAELDLSADIELYRRVFAAAKSLDLAVEEKLPLINPEARAEIIHRISDGFVERDSALIEQLSAPVLTPWPEAPRDTVAGKLKDVAQKLTSGLSEYAKEVLSEISNTLDTINTAERAEYWFLTGKCMSQDSREAEAADAYKTAYGLCSNSVRYKTAWIETELRTRFDGVGKVDFSDLKANLTSGSSEEVALHARILSAEGKYAEAEEMLKALPKKDGQGTLAILMTMQSNWRSVIELCDDGLCLDGIKDETKQLFYLLRARAKFHISMPDSALYTTGGIVPVFGPSGLNTVSLTAAWDDIEKTTELMSAAGWPTNVGYFADVWACTSMMLSKEKITLPLMHAAARKRPRETGLQEALERIAMQCGEWDIALEANSAQLEGGDQLLRRVTLLYQAKRYSECIALFEKNLDRLPKGNDKYRLCLSLVILAADELVRPDIGEKIEKLLQQESEWEHEVAIISYYRAIARDALARNAAAQLLSEEYSRLGKPKIIAQQLLHALSAFDIEQAGQCVEVSNDLRKEQQLSVEAELHLAQAYTTLGKWGALLDLVNNVIKRFADISRFHAIRAFALDKLGYSSEALAQLKEIINNRECDNVAVNTYINIAVRCGYSEDAIFLVEKLLGQENKSDKKFDFLRLLFSLVQMSRPHSQRAEEIAWRMGVYARQEIEAEEGVFILAYLTSTLPATVATSEQRRLELQSRIAKFTEKFPDSKIFRVGQITSDSDPKDLMRILNNLVGNNPDADRKKIKYLAQLKKGELQIPFAWRPKNVLSNVADVAALWQITKSAKKDANQYRLNMVVREADLISRQEVAGKIPLLDLVTLLVLVDLRLINVVFSIFQKVAISQNTLMELQRLATPMVGSWARAQCQELAEILKSNINNIVQPISMSVQADGKKIKLSGYEDTEELLQDNRFFLYSDDGIYRAYSSSMGKVSISTLDLLEMAEDLKLMTPLQTARVISQLCMWNVDVIVQLKHLVAIVPASAATAKCVDDVITVIHSDPYSSALFEGIWNVRKNYIDILRHVSSLLSLLLSNPKNTVRTISGIGGVWFSSARLRTDVGDSTPLERLAQLIAFTAAHSEASNPSVLRRLFEVYIDLVSFEWGDRMDERREEDAIRELAKFAAELDHGLEEKSTSRLGQLLSKAFTEGTAEHSYFTRGYGDRALRLRVEQRIAKH